MDKVEREKRSWIMSRVKGRDTKPELLVRSLLHRLGYRFRLQRGDLPGKPDIVLPRFHTAIFVHGCFWHRHPGCRRASMPAANVEYWQNKFSRNVDRDAKNRELLEQKGWHVLVVWECELNDLQSLATKLITFLTNVDHDGNARERLPEAT